MERVDVQGETCPRPALVVRRELEEKEPGDELLVVGDYPPAEDNITRTCEDHGYHVEDAGETESAFRLKITVPEDRSVEE